MSEACVCYSLRTEKRRGHAHTRARAAHSRARLRTVRQGISWIGGTYTGAPSPSLSERMCISLGTKSTDDICPQKISRKKKSKKERNVREAEEDAVDTGKNEQKSNITAAAAAERESQAASRAFDYV